jgi:two-component system NarL family response regulator
VKGIKEQRQEAGLGKIRLLLVFRNEIFREGLARLLGVNPAIHVAGTSSGAAEAIEKVIKLKPDVVLLDTELAEGNCVDLIKRICELQPETKVIIFTDSSESRNLLDALRAGAMSYMTKNITSECLIKVITLTMEGEVIIGAPLAKKLFAEFVSLEAEKPPQTKYVEILSEREREVLSMVAQGATNREIAAALFISEHTVKVHLHNILEKLHVHNRQQATAIAIEEGLKPSLVKGVKQ